MRANRRVTSNKKSGLVLQNHITVGIQVPQDLRRIRIIDVVPNHRRGGRLQKGGGFSQPNIEALPVNRSPVRSSNRELQTLTAEAGTPLCDRPANRVGP